MTLRRAHFRGDPLEPLEINAAVTKDMPSKYVCIEGVLLPRNADGSLQYDEHTKIAPEAAENLLIQLQEAQEASRDVIKLCLQSAPMEQIERADATASILWREYHNSRRLAAADWLKGIVVKSVRETMERARHEAHNLHRMQDDGCPHGN